MKDTEQQITSCTVESEERKKCRKKIKIFVFFVV